MKKGTILYVGNFELPDLGAAANRVVSNGKIFQKLGYRCAYLGVKKNADFVGIHPLDADRHMYEEAYPQGSKEWFIHMCSVKHIRTLVEQYQDVRMIILYNAPYLLLDRVKRTFRHRNIKVVYDCTEWTGVTEGSLPKRMVKKLDLHFIRHNIADRADGLIVISKRMKEAYGNCRHLILIPPLIDLEDSIWHQTREHLDDYYEFCFAGILDGNKESLDSIVEAFGKLQNPKRRLRIIGVTKQEFYNHYAHGKELLEKSGGQILFMGRLSHEETIKYVLGCDCYIFIRQSDLRNNAGFPTKFAEAFSCGVPIITTDISDIKSYLTGNVRGQVLGATSAIHVKTAMEHVMALGNAKEMIVLDDTFHYEQYLEPCQAWMEGLG